MTFRTVFAVVLSVLVATGLSGCGPGNVDGAEAGQLTSISVTPSNSQIARNSSAKFTATGIYSDNTTKDLTSSVTWQTSNPTVADVSDAPPTKGEVTSSASGNVTISASYGGVSGSASIVVSPATLVSLAITPVQPSIARGTQRQFTATGTYSDNSTQDLTSSVTWRSSSTAVATIIDTAGSKGLATGVAAGTVTITATSGSVSSTTTLTVTPATLTSLAVTPANPTLAVGLSRQFTVTGTYSDNSTQDLTATATWSSSNTTVAKATTGVKGSFTAQATGTATITAASGSLSGSTTLTVTPATLSSIAITPANPSIARGTTRQFTATGTYSDSSTQDLTQNVVWSSSNTAVATISNAAGSKGLATSLATGSTVITAASGSVSATANLTVTAAALVSIAVTPANPSVAAGSTAQYTATGTYTDGSTQNLTTTVTWGTSTSAIAAVSNAAGSKGLATGVAAGTTTVSATSGSISGSASITVTPAATGSIALAWDAATTYSDGSPITDLAGYKLYYGTTAGSYTSSVDVGNVTTYTLTQLPAGTYYVVVTVRNTSGSESPHSNQVSKTIF